MSILVNLAGIAFILFIIYWFWLSQAKTGVTTDTGSLEVKVANGVYSPSVIEAPAGKPLKLLFRREDPSPCAQKVVFADFDLTEELPLGKTKTITIPAQAAGSYKFTCQMQMYQGTLKII